MASSSVSATNLGNVNYDAPQLSSWASWMNIVGSVPITKAALDHQTWKKNIYFQFKVNPDRSIKCGVIMTPVDLTSQTIKIPLNCLHQHHAILFGLNVKELDALMIKVFGSHRYYAELKHRMVSDVYTFLYEEVPKKFGKDLCLGLYVFELSEELASVMAP